MDLRTWLCPLLVLLLVLAGCVQSQPPVHGDPLPADGGHKAQGLTDAERDPDPGPRPEALWRGDLERTGFTANETVPDQAERAWWVRGFNKGDHTAAKGSVVVHNDTLLVGADTGTLYRLTLDGEVLWAAATHPSGFGIHGSPAVAGDTVYVGAYDGALYAYWLANGTQRWRTVLGGAIGSSPAIYDGRVFVSVETPLPDGHVSVVDAGTGAVLWEDHRLTDHPHSSVALSPRHDRWVVGSNDGRVYAWTLGGLEHVWTFETGGEVKGPIALWDGGAFFGSWDHRVYRVDLRNGTLDWSFETGGEVMAGVAVDPRSGTVLVGGYDDHLYALDAATGQKRWSVDLGEPVLSSATVADGRVVVGGHDGAVYAFDVATGQRLWRVDLGGGAVTSSPAVHDGVIYVLDRAGQRAGSLHALRATAQP